MNPPKSFKSIPILLFIIGIVLCSAATKVSGYQIRVKGILFNVDLAITAKQQEKGLAGRGLMPEDSGMLFIYDSPKNNRIFWMKGMLIPIDILWINTGRIVHIEHSVEPPDNNVPLNKIPRYGRGIIADAVLEVGAGISKDYNIHVGDTVDY